MVIVGGELEGTLMGLSARCVHRVRIVFSHIMSYTHQKNRTFFIDQESSFTRTIFYVIKKI
eukprot:SAG25_NODE_397_length_8510_cov_7.345619_2_plen_61_part_00